MRRSGLRGEHATAGFSRCFGRRGGCMAANGAGAAAGAGGRASRRLDAGIRCFSCGRNSPGRVGLMAMLDVNCLWLGGALGDLEQVCLLSMLRQGHKVRLFFYDKLTNVPSGIEISDAREIMPREELIVHRASGSPSLGSNKFRYLIMENDLGIWLDTDVILLSPLLKTQDYIFGWEEYNSINCAVFYSPKDSLLNEEIIEFISQRYPIPPFYDSEVRLELEQKSRSGFPVDVRDLPWGVYGPQALTYFVKKNCLLHFANPERVFYPVHWSDAHVLVSSKYNVNALISKITIAIHLWNSCLRRPSKIRPQNPVGKLLIEKGCFVERFAREQLGYRLSETVETLPNVSGPSPTDSGGVSRNAPCPCGSGKKFKHCHGRFA